MTDSKIDIKTKVTYTLRKKDTGEEESYVSHNDPICTAGRIAVSEKIHGISDPAAFNYIAVGDGSTATEADTTLSGTELGRKLGTASRITGTSTIRIIVTFGTTEANGTIRESGLFNAATAGTLLSHDLKVPVITKTSEDELDVTYEVSY